MFQLSYKPEMMLQLLEPLFFPLVHQKTHVATVGLAKKKKKKPKKHLLRFPLKQLRSWWSVRWSVFHLWNKIMLDMTEKKDTHNLEHQ